jgi:hypothetical protein
VATVGDHFTWRQGIRKLRVKSAGICFVGEINPPLGKKRTASWLSFCSNRIWLNVLLWLLLGGVGRGGFGCGVGVFLGEAFDAARSVQELLFAGEERVAIGADFDAQHCAFDRRARGEIVSTGTVNRNRVIVRVNTGFHESPFWSRPVCAACCD